MNVQRMDTLDFELDGEDEETDLQMRMIGSTSIDPKQTIQSSRINFMEFTKGFDNCPQRKGRHRLPHRLASPFREHLSKPDVEILNKFWRSSDNQLFECFFDASEREYFHYFLGFVSGKLDTHFSVFWDFACPTAPQHNAMLLEHTIGRRVVMAQS